MRCREGLLFEGEVFGLGEASSGKTAILALNKKDGVVEATQRGMFKGTLLHSSDLERIEWITLNDGGKRRSAGVVLAVGASGLLIRKGTTVVTVRAADAEFGVLANEKITEVTQQLRRFGDSVPGLLQKVHLGEPPAGSHPSTSEVDELERLASLFREGLLTEEEYRTMKDRLIG